MLYAHPFAGEMRIHPARHRVVAFLVSPASPTPSSRGTDSAPEWVVSTCTVTAHGPDYDGEKHLPIWNEIEMSWFALFGCAAHATDVITRTPMMCQGTQQEEPRCRSSQQPIS